MIYLEIIVCGLAGSLGLGVVAKMRVALCP